MKRFDTAMAAVAFSLLLAGCGGANTTQATSAAATPVPAIDASASAMASPQTPSAAPSSVTSNVRVCQQVQADYIVATRKAPSARTDAVRNKVSALEKEGAELECRLLAYWRGDSGTSGSSLPVMNGIAFKWADNPDCGYSSCFGMTIRAESVSCPGGIYAEINLLDADGTVVGYSNDVVGSLVQGQKAKLIFNVTESGVKSAQLTDITCR